MASAQEVESSVSGKDYGFTGSSAAKTIDSFLWRPLNSSDSEDHSQKKSVGITYNLKDYHARLSSYINAAWLASDVTPSEFSRHGWSYMEPHILRCLKCKEVLYTKLPPPNKRDSYKKFLEVLKAALTSKHDSACVWISSSCPRSFSQPPVLHTREDVYRLSDGAREIACLGENMPRISVGNLLTKFGLDDDHIRFIYSTTTDVTDAQKAALVLVLCGWKRHSNKVDLWCDLCHRRIDMSNFLCVCDPPGDGYQSPQLPLSSLDVDSMECDHVEVGGLASGSQTTQTVKLAEEVNDAKEHAVSPKPYQMSLNAMPEGETSSVEGKKSPSYNRVRTLTSPPGQEECQLVESAAEPAISEEECIMAVGGKSPPQFSAESQLKLSCEPESPELEESGDDKLCVASPEIEPMCASPEETAVSTEKECLLRHKSVNQTEASREKMVPIAEEIETSVIQESFESKDHDMHDTSSVSPDLKDSCADITEKKLDSLTEQSSPSLNPEAALPERETELSHPEDGKPQDIKVAGKSQEFIENKDSVEEKMAENIPGQEPAEVKATFEESEQSSASMNAEETTKKTEIPVTQSPEEKECEDVPASDEHKNNSPKEIQNNSDKTDASPLAISTCQEGPAVNKSLEVQTEVVDNQPSEKVEDGSESLCIKDRYAAVEVEEITASNKMEAPQTAEEDGKMSGINTDTQSGRETLYNRLSTGQKEGSQITDLDSTQVLDASPDKSCEPQVMEVTESPSTGDAARQPTQEPDVPSELPAEAHMPLECQPNQTEDLSTGTNVSCIPDKSDSSVGEIMSASEESNACGQTEAGITESCTNKEITVVEHINSASENYESSRISDGGEIVDVPSSSTSKPYSEHQKEHQGLNEQVKVSSAAQCIEDSAAVNTGIEEAIHAEVRHKRTHSEYEDDAEFSSETLAVTADDGQSAKKQRMDFSGHSSDCVPGHQYKEVESTSLSPSSEESRNKVLKAMEGTESQETKEDRSSTASKLHPSRVKYNMITARKKVEFDPVEDHRGWCAWLNGERDTNLPSVKGCVAFAENIKKIYSLASMSMLQTESRYNTILEGLRLIRQNIDEWIAPAFLSDDFCETEDDFCMAETEELTSLPIQT